MSEWRCRYYSAASETSGRVLLRQTDTNTEWNVVAAPDGESIASTQRQSFGTCLCKPVNLSERQSKRARE